MSSGAWFYGLSSDSQYEVEVVFPTGNTVRSSQVFPDAYGYFIDESGDVVSLQLPPVDLNTSTSLTITENQPVGTIVGEFNATDPEGGAITYNFVESGKTITLSSPSTPTARSRPPPLLITKATPSTYTITVKAKDELNASIEGNFTVTLLDVYEDTDGMDSGIL